MKNKMNNNISNINFNNQEKNKTQDNDSENKSTTDNLKNGINLDYDYNTEYGDGDIPDVDK